VRTLHLIRSMNPQDGGPPEVVRQLSQKVVDLGDSVEIACLDHPSERFLQSLPCPVHALGPASGIYGYSAKLPGWLERNILRFDHLIIHGVWQFVTMAGSRAAYGRIPYFVFVHGAMDPWFKRQYPLKHLKKCLYWPLLYPALHRANALLFTGTQEKNLATESFWPHAWRSRVLTLGIDPPEEKIASQVEAFCLRVPEVRDRRFFLFMARIHEKTGCELLIRACARLGAEHPDVDLVMAGPDQSGYKAQLQEIVRLCGLEHRVHWPGMLTGEAKYGAYRSCEAFVLPSHQENFGVAVAEALACGRPVLISNKVEIWEQITDEGAGLVDDDSLEGTERLLTRWLRMDTEEQHRIANRARPCFEKYFSLTNSARMLQEILVSEANPSPKSQQMGISLHGLDTKSDVRFERNT
jgi:glycosyltransferase involved in cell wall biosynthesis